MNTRRWIAGLAGVGLVAAVAVAPALADDGPPDLEPFSGVLDDDGSAYSVSGSPVDFGTELYLTTQSAPADRHGDGVVELAGEALTSLVGTTVALEVERGRGGALDVFSVSGSECRDPESGPPPWAGFTDPDAGPSAWVPGPPPWAGEEGGESGDGDDPGPHDWAPSPPPWAGQDEDESSD